jgi:4-amino-4-deoxy-L-arabinose transferase-like glycosyltransferase
LLLGLTALLLMSAAGAAPLERAEIYFVDCARAMVERGDYVVPYYRGQPFFDKPPLVYWLIAGAFNVFGFTLEAARLVPSLAGVATVLVTVWLGSLLFDRECGLLAGLLLATTGAFMSFGRLAMADMLLTLCCVSALALGAALARARSRGERVGLAAALGAVLALGFLVKGPIALLLPGLGLLVMALKHRQLLHADALAAAALALLALGLPWFVLVHSRLGWPPLTYFFLHENLERFAGETYDSGRSPLYYLAVYAAEGIPWSPLLALALPRLRREASVQLLGVWLALAMVPLSLSRGKIDYYLLPLYPAASLLIARWLRGSWNGFETAVVRTALVAGAIVLALAVRTLDALPAAFLPSAGSLALLRTLTGLGAAALLLVAWRPSRNRLVAALAGSACGVTLLITTLLMPALSRAQPNAEIVADVMRERRYRKDAQLVFCDDPTRVARDLLFEARIATVERCDLWAPAASSFPFLLLVRDDQRETLRSATRFVGEYRYVPATVTTLRTLLDEVRPETLVLLANYGSEDPEADLRARRDRKRRVRARELRDTQGAGENRVP